MTAISEIVEKLLPALVADPWAGSAAARVVMELGPRGIQSLLRILGTAPGDTQARGLFVVDGLLLEFHARRLMEQRTQVVLHEKTSPRQALTLISDQLGMDIETADAPLSDSSILPPGRFAMAELLSTITAAMPGWI